MIFNHILQKMCAYMLENDIIPQRFKVMYITNRRYIYTRRI